MVLSPVGFCNSLEPGLPPKAWRLKSCLVPVPDEHVTWMSGYSLSFPHDEGLAPMIGLSMMPLPFSHQVECE